MLIICATKQEAKEIAEAIAALHAATEDEEVTILAVQSKRIVWTNHEFVTALPPPGVK